MHLTHLILVIALGALETVYCHMNNVCNTIEDYKTINDNPNCRYSYYVNSTVPEIIQQSRRPLETHQVTTEDGHILTVFRIPNSRQKNPVFLQHGLITSCANWIALGENSLAFQLHDNGYDVWMGNYRGTHYSQGHLNYTINDKEFWNHGLDEVSLFDIPAMLKYVSNATRGQKIIYIGHSLGTTISLMYTSDKVKDATKFLKMQILTAPAHRLESLKSNLRYFRPFADAIYNAVNQIDGLLKVASKEQSTKTILKTLCLDSPEMMNQCMSIIFHIYGPKTEVNPEMYPLYFAQHPAGTAFKILKQCSDMANGNFRKFDYGKVRNRKKYGSDFPPVYDVSKIKVPTIVILARNDWLTPKEGAINLYKSLSPDVRRGIYEVTEENFNHIDFMFGAKAKQLYVDKILILLKKFK